MAANPVSGRLVLNVGQLVDVPVGGNPHRWYSPSDVHAVIDQITRRLPASRPARRRLLRHPAHGLSQPRPGPLRSAHRGHQGQVRGHPGGRLGEHLRAACPGARPAAAHAAELPGRHQRGHRADGRRQDDDRSPDRSPPDQGLRLQLAERDPRCADPGAGGSGGGHPGDDHHRDPRPRIGHLPGVAGQPSSRPCRRLWPRPPGTRRPAIHHAAASRPQRATTPRPR